ncbi:MAG: hypothetical protein M0Q26_09905 [Chitinophagaceae bacterium]|nr:hypothetical protein [Chitinophagaceae bacterium]MDP1811576.1 hypothetical protein [Sediminibacterium sp.]MDP3127334.1 hypothetical protein [Sediminibacterium sp.]
MRKKYFDYTNLVQAINRTINKLIPVKERNGNEVGGNDILISFVVEVS